MSRCKTTRRATTRRVVEKMFCRDEKSMYNQRSPLNLMRGLAALLVILPVTTLISCAFNNQFKERSIGESHAVLTAAPADAVFDRGPTVFSINGQPTSFWHTQENFKIAPGLTTINVIADIEPYDFEPMKFDAQTGHHYHLRYESGRANATLYDITDPSKVRFVIRSRRLITTTVQGAATGRNAPPTLNPTALP